MLTCEEFTAIIREREMTKENQTEQNQALETQTKNLIKAMNEISDMNGARHQQVLAATLAAGFFANPNITQSLKEADIQGVYDSCFKLARLITE
jgi:hypothetical protein